MLFFKKITIENMSNKKDFEIFVQEVENGKASIIGKGGYGIIYTSDSFPTLVLKISHARGRNCRTFVDEYKIIKDIERNSITKCNSRVSVLFSYYGLSSKDQCMFTSDYVRSPIKYTVNAMLGETNMDKYFTGRGQFWGLNQLKRYLTYEELMLLINELGCNIARLHYLTKIDCYDIEIWFGKVGNQKKFRFFIGDFDLVKFITEYDKETIDNMAWAIDAVSYFPRKDVDIKLFNIFVNSYIQTANNYGMIEIAKKVIDKYD